jgi:hypothetical protein
VIIAGMRSSMAAAGFAAAIGWAFQALRAGFNGAAAAPTDILLVIWRP